MDVVFTLHPATTLIFIPLMSMYTNYRSVIYFLQTIIFTLYTLVIQLITLQQQQNLVGQILMHRQPPYSAA